MGYTYHAEQWLPYSIQVIFAFFADPDNLPLLMPEWQKARIEKVSMVPPPRSASQASGPVVAAGVGSRITLSFRPFPYSPLRIRWQAEIAEFDWNDYFCDRQLRGPFAHWNHCHRIKPANREGIDGTLIIDDVEYDLPFGALGRAAHRLFLRRQIERTFASRQKEIARMFRHVTSGSTQSQTR